MSTIPDYLRSTIGMIRSAYPNGIPDQDYYLLIYILSTKGMISDRQVAKVVSIIKGGGYVRYLNDVGYGLSYIDEKDQDEINRVVEILSDHGYSAWLKEPS